MNGVEAGIFYSFKGMVKAEPYQFLVYSLSVSILIPGYSLRIFERPLVPYSGLDFNSIINCFWYMIITMTTVGYGDYSAYSFKGRLISIIIMIWGVFIQSMFVVTLTRQLVFSMGEQKSFDILNKLRAKEQLKEDAVKVLEQAFIKMRNEKKEPDNIRKLLNNVRDFRGRILQFKNTIKKVRSLYSGSNMIERMTNLLERENEMLSVLEENQGQAKGICQDVSRELVQIQEREQKIKEEQQKKLISKNTPF